MIASVIAKVLRPKERGPDMKNGGRDQERKAR